MSTAFTSLNGHTKRGGRKQNRIPAAPVKPAAVRSVDEVNDLLTAATTGDLSRPAATPAATAAGGITGFFAGIGSAIATAAAAVVTTVRRVGRWLSGTARGTWGFTVRSAGKVGVAVSAVGHSLRIAALWTARALGLALFYLIKALLSLVLGVISAVVAFFVGVRAVWVRDYDLDLPLVSF